MARSLPIRAVPQLVRAAGRRVVAVAGFRQKLQLLEAIRKVTRHLTIAKLGDLIGSDASLYQDYLWPAERAALRSYLVGHGAELADVSMPDVLALIEQARPELVELVRALDAEYDGMASAWLSRQWTEIKGAAL